MEWYLFLFIPFLGIVNIFNFWPLSIISNPAHPRRFLNSVFVAYLQ